MRPNPLFPKNYYFLPPVTHAYVCVTGLRNVCFSEKGDMFPFAKEILNENFIFCVISKTSPNIIFSIKEVQENTKQKTMCTNLPKVT